MPYEGLDIECEKAARQARIEKMARELFIHRPATIVNSLYAAFRLAEEFERYAESQRNKRRKE